MEGRFFSFKKILLIFSLFLSFDVCAKEEVNFKTLLKGKWVEVNSPNFRIITDAKEKNAAQYAVELEQFRHFVTMYLGLDQAENVEPPVFVLIQNKGRLKSAGLPKQAAGMFYLLPDGSFAVSSASGFKKNQMKASFERHTILHELVHFLDLNSKTKVKRPIWYTEGMAEYLATFSVNDKIVSIGNPEYLVSRFYAMRVNWGSDRKKSVDIEDLFKAKTTGMGKNSDREVESFYGRSFLTIHYLSKGEDARALDYYIAYLSRGLSEDEAFAKAFKRTYADLTKEVDDYMNSNDFYGFNYPKEALKFPEVKTTMTPLKKDDAFFTLADVLLRQKGVLNTPEKRQKLVDFLEKHYADDERRASVLEKITEAELRIF